MSREQRHAPSRRRARAEALLVMAALAGCSSGFEPPERTLAVRAQEAALAPVVEAAARGLGFAGEGGCEVRLLGTEGDVSFVWGGCSFAGPSGVSAPFRVEGTRAVLPGDGSRYDDDVRRLFPSRMVEAILQHSDDLRPR